MTRTNSATAPWQLMSSQLHFLGAAVGRNTGDGESFIARSLSVGRGAAKPEVRATRRWAQPVIVVGRGSAEPSRK